MVISHLKHLTYIANHEIIQRILVQWSSRLLAFSEDFDAVHFGDAFKAAFDELVGLLHRLGNGHVELIVAALE